MTARLEDAQARIQALKPQESFIVQAPAGSGKTELLVQRFLRLLAVVEAPEEIVAITFTRKAAGEMRERILKELAAAETPPAEPHKHRTWQLARAALARDQARGWNLAEHPARLRVLTIDAFNLSLARRLPWLSRLGGTPAVVEEAEPLYRRAARQTLAVLEAGGTAGAAAARLLRHLDYQVERTEELLSGMLTRRDQWLRHITAASTPRETLERGWARVTREILTEARQALAPFEDDITACARHAACMLQETRPEAPVLACAELQALPPPEPDHLPQWKGLAELLLTGEGDWRKPRGLNKNNGFPNESREQKDAKRHMGGLLQRLAKDNTAARVPGLLSLLPEPCFSDADWEVIAALLALLPEAVGQLREEFRRGAVADFIEIAQAALASLEGRAGGEPVRHLLVDEFQDTSTSQFRLLERLVADWRPEDGRTLFLVGDPMQSIYRFREAEVGLFLRARCEGIGALKLRPVLLRSNFRSDGAIVAWVNQAFAQVFPPQAEILTGTVPYTPAAAVHPASDAGAVTVHPIVVPKEHRNWGHVLEAEQVANLAQRARQDEPHGTVAILVRARTHLKEILPALHAVGLAYRAVEIDALAEQPVVRDLMALTRALLYPADRVAWLAVLRAPFCGLSLADLLALAGQAPEAALWERIQDEAVHARLSPEGRERLERARAALGEALKHRARAGLRAWVENTWLALGGPAGVQPLELDHARAYLAVLEALEQSGAEPTPEELARRVEGLYAEPDPDPGAVQVMTIHKAKGLEFDTVIVPGLGRLPRQDTPSLLRWQELPGGGADSLLLSPIGETGLEQNPNSPYLGRLERKKADQELRRLAYVAATRAKRYLHLLGVAEADGDKVKTPDPRSLLGILWPVLQERFENEPLKEPPERAGVDAPGERPAVEAPPLRRLPAAWSSPPPPPGVPRPHAAAEEAEERTPIEYSWAGFTARRVGTVVHRWLLRIARDGVDAWSPARLVEQTPRIRAMLAQEGVPDAELEGGVERTLGALHEAVTGDKGRWVLQRHADGRSEYDLTAVLDGEIRRLRVDRTFVDAEGRRWIVDYKTSTHEGGGLEAFLDREVERYRETMARYARVMRALEPERPVRLALYFPLIAGGWREWDDTG